MVDAVTFRLFRKNFPLFSVIRIFNFLNKSFLTDLQFGDRPFQVLWSHGNCPSGLNMEISLVLQEPDDNTETINVTVSCQPKIIKNWWPSLIRSIRIVRLPNTPPTRTRLRQWIVLFMQRNHAFFEDDNDIEMHKLHYYSMINLKRLALRLIEGLSIKLIQTKIEDEHSSAEFEHVLFDPETNQISEEMETGSLHVFLPHVFPAAPVGTEIVEFSDSEDIVKSVKKRSGGEIKIIKGQVEDGQIAFSYYESMLNVILNRLDEFDQDDDEEVEELG